MRLRLWRLPGARRGRRDAKAIVAGTVVGTETETVAIAITIPNADDTAMRERMIVDTVIIAATVGIGLGHQLRRNDLTADTAVSETVNTTVIAERIDAEAMMVTVEMVMVTVEANDIVEATVTAMVNVTAVTARREEIPTQAKLETETRVLGVIVIMIVRDPPDDHHLAEVLLRSEPSPALIVVMMTDGTTLDETTTIATTHTTETAAHHHHLLPSPRLISQTPSSRRKSVSASSRKCNQMPVNLRQNDASGYPRSMPKNKRRRKLMISYALTVVNSCPRYISVCRKIAWMNAFGAVAVDCPRWRRIKNLRS